MSLNNTFCPKNKKMQKRGWQSCPRLVYSRYSQGTDAKPDGRQIVTVTGHVLTWLYVVNQASPAALLQEQKPGKKIPKKSQKKCLTKTSRCDKIGTARKSNPFLGGRNEIAKNPGNRIAIWLLPKIYHLTNHWVVRADSTLYRTAYLENSMPDISFSGVGRFTVFIR